MTTEQRKTINNHQELVEEYKQHAGSGAALPVDFINTDFNCPFNFSEIFTANGFRPAREVREGRRYYRSNALIHFENCNFSENINLTEIIFFEKVKFIKCNFEKDFTCNDITHSANTFFSEQVEFTDVKFKSVVDFSHSVFEGKLLFSNSTFDKRVDFEKTQFKDEVTFENTIFDQTYFQSISIPKTITFQRNIFNQEIRFSNCIFDAKTDFKNSQFNDSLEISGCTFNEDLNHSNSQFKRRVSIENCTFNKSLFITNSTYKSSSEEGFKFYKNDLNETIQFHNIELFKDHSLIIDDCNISNNSGIIVSFSKNNEGQIHFKNINNLSNKTIAYIAHSHANTPTIAFEDCTLLPKSVHFSDISIDNIKTSSSSEWFGFTFTDCHWPKTTIDSNVILGPLKFYALPDENEFIEHLKTAPTQSTNMLKKQRQELYKHLKKEYQQSADNSVASSFYAMQMYWARQSNTDNALWNTLYYYLSGYGLSVYRSLLFLILFADLFYLFYFLLKIYSPSYTDIEPLKLSLEGLNPFIWKNDSFKDMPDPQYITIWVLSVVHHILSLFFLFEIGSAIREKVRKSS